MSYVLNIYMHTIYKYLFHGQNISLGDCKIDGPFYTKFTMEDIIEKQNKSILRN